MRQEIFADDTNNHFGSAHVGACRVGRIVHQNVHSAKILQHALSCFRHLIAVRHITRVRVRSFPTFSDSVAATFQPMAMLKRKAYS